MQGQEPGLFEFLGHDRDLLARADEADERRWHAWTRWFRAHGRAPRLAFLPPATPELEAFDDPPAWTLVGGLFRVVRDGGWVVSQPQPVTARPDTWAWPGSVCERRGHHALIDRGEVTVCDDCHEVSC